MKPLDIARLITEDPDVIKCPACGESGAYVGFSTVECPNRRCRHFSPKIRRTDRLKDRLKDKPVDEFDDEYFEQFIESLSEDYCSACGGWDKEQMGRGHKLGCPKGEPGTPIARATAIAPQPTFVRMEAWRGRGPGWYYDRIKEFGGVIVIYDDDWNHWYRFIVGFDNSQDASEAVHELTHELGPGNFSARKQDAKPRLLKDYASGVKDAEFVREYDLS